MDEELHEHVDNVSVSKGVPSGSYETAPLTDVEPDESSTSIPADDDSFGEATPDCVPDKKFLEAILEDYHPARFHLLNPTPPGSATKPVPDTQQESAKTNEYGSASNDPSKSSTANQPAEPIKSSGDAETSSGNPRKEELDTQPKTNNVRTSSGSPKKDELDAQPKTCGEEGERDEEEEGEVTESGEGTESGDVFPTGEQVSPSRPGLRQDVLGGMGKSTKKSFRRINGTFWSKPFKSLGRSLRTNGKNGNS